MRIVRTAALEIGLVLLSATLAMAADTNAGTAAGPTAVKAAPAAKQEPTAGKGGTNGIKDAIVGSWKSVDDGEVWEFATDGNARVKSNIATFVATYEILNDGSLHLEVPVFGKQKDFVYQFVLQGDQLTLTNKDQKPRTYDRLK